jgi:hypothetical protein
MRTLLEDDRIYRAIWRAFAIESTAAKSTAVVPEPQDCTVQLREFYQSTAGLPELHRLIDQLRPRYPADTIDGLCQVLAAAEARLSPA